MQKLLDWLDSVPVDGFLLVGEKPKNKTTERNPFDGFGRGTRT